MIKFEDMKDGFYYIQEKHGVEIGEWDSDHQKWNGIYGGKDENVIGEVPSYDEWQAKLEENIKLKELLKECQNMIAFKHEVYEEDALIKEIDEALK